MTVNRKNNARRARLRAADLSVVPEAASYEPPPKHACEPVVTPVPLDDEGLVQFVYAQQIYRQYVVHFSIEIQCRGHALADWQTIYRIDTSHGTVHEHVFSASGEREIRQVIETIPTEDGWATVDRWFNRALDMCDDCWETQVERWKR
ncbi:hypothetical protein ACFT5B_07040 [Luteimicrobium sp. NPDC057192]|uniref:DUF7718 family protein n=1 Tax=Luteimicrobium sp. NPDC057192 TaxID=3346042 RepID=UPI003635903A